MNEKINSLLKLQEFDAQLDAQTQGLARLTPLREQLRNELAQLQKNLDDAKKASTQAQVDKKNLELDIETKEQAIRKNSGELNSVKSNDAYKALLGQIEEAKKAKASLEDQVLALMENIEGLQKEAKERDKTFQADKAGVEKRIAELDAEEARFKSEAERLRGEREAYARSLSNSLRLQYDGIRRGRTGFLPVVAIKGNICGGCRMTLPPSVVNDAMKGGDIVACESCSRILFVPKAPAAPENPAPVQ